MGAGIKSALGRKGWKMTLEQLKEKYDSSESNLVQHAWREMQIVGGLDDEWQCQIVDNILELVDRFSKQGHSGASASYVLGFVTKLMDFRPVTPLTGEDSEWNEVGFGEHECWQNNRFSQVFKDSKDGPAYWSEGKIFSDDGGKSWWVNSGSRVFIKFPFMPGEPERVLVAKEGGGEE